MTYADATAQVLTRTDNPAVMWGDAGLLDEIWGLVNPDGDFKLHPLKRWERVLAGLDRAVAAGDRRFSKGFTGSLGRRVRVFRLKEVTR